MRSVNTAVDIIPIALIPGSSTPSIKSANEAIGVTRSTLFNIRPPLARDGTVRPTNPAQQHDGQTTRQRLQGLLPTNTLGGTVTPRGAECSVRNVSRVPVLSRRVPGAAGLAPLRSRLHWAHPGSESTVHRAESFAWRFRCNLNARCWLGEEPDPKRQRRIRRPRNRSCVGDQSKRRAHREAVADMESPGWRGFSVVGNRISTNAPSEITGRHSASGTANSFSINVDRSA